MPFGITATNNLAGFMSRNYRRKVFYQYPTGAAPLMGLLSMLQTEETDKVDYGWYEQRFPVQRTQTVASGTAPFLTGAGGSFTDGANFVADTEYRVNVVSTAEFKPTHVIEIANVALTAGNVDIIGTVTEINSATQLTFRPDAAWTAVQNASTENNGLVVRIIGTANQEGARSGVGILTYPTSASNSTQIFRTAFNVTRTALKAALDYDKSGVYATKAKDNGLRHMIELEKAFLWGRRHTVNVTDPETGEITPETKTGGVRWFLEQWEAANSIYRGGSGAAAITSNTDPQKRILDFGGTMSKSQYKSAVAKAFTTTSNSAYEKLVLCGGNFFDAVNELFERDVNRTATISDSNRNWEFFLHSHTTARGVLHYSVHPLFNEDPQWVNGAMILDMSNLRYRYLSDSDTTFLKGRQENDRDGRKDEWITEAGLELRFPESCMIIKNAGVAA